MKMVRLKEHRNWGPEHLWFKLILTPSSSSCVASGASLPLLALHPLPQGLLTSPACTGFILFYFN